MLNNVPEEIIFMIIKNLEKENDTKYLFFKMNIQTILNLKEINKYFYSLINKLKNSWMLIPDKSIKKNYNIDNSCDLDIIKPFFRDWSNLNGFADLLVRPSNKIQCAIILRTCVLCKIILSISAGKTNLTGSATPYGGIVLSTSLLTSPSININHNLEQLSETLSILTANLFIKALKKIRFTDIRWEKVLRAVREYFCKRN